MTRYLEFGLALVALAGIGFAMAAVLDRPPQKEAAPAALPQQFTGGNPKIRCPNPTRPAPTGPSIGGTTWRWDPYSCQWVRYSGNTATGVIDAAGEPVNVP